MRIILILGIILMICGLAGLLLCMIRTDDKIVVRNYINKRIIEIFKSGRADEIYNFYNNFIGNKEATICIINTALIFDIPVNYFVGLAYQESKFNCLRKSKKNSDGSCDIGIFQLNTKIYKKYDINYLFIIQNNVRMAGAHLADNYQRVDNWYSALGIYNAGHEKKVNFSYVKNILLYADKLDNEFSQAFQ